MGRFFATSFKGKKKKKIEKNSIRRTIIMAVLDFFMLLNYIEAIEICLLFNMSTLILESLRSYHSLF